MPLQSTSVARSTLWNHAGKLTDYIAWYCSSVLIARGLGVELNGMLASMISGIHLALAFSSLGLEVAINKFLPQFTGEDAVTVSRSITRRIASARLLLYVLTAAAAVVALVVLGGRDIAPDAPTLTVLLVYGLFRGLAPLAAMVLVARWHADKAAVIGGTTRLLELVAFALLYTAGMSITTVFLILTCTLILQLIGYVIAARAYWFGSAVAVPMKPIWIFGSIFWANTLVDYFLGRQGDILFLTLLSPSAGSAALYDVSYSILQAGSMAVTVGFSGVTLAAFARLAIGDRTQMDRFYGTLVRITTFLVLPVLGFLFVTASDLIPLLYSSTYAGAVVVLQVMLGFRIFCRLFAGGENADYLLAVERVKDLVLIGVAGAVVTVTCHLILIPRFDVVGAAWAAGIGTVTANLLSNFRVRQLGSTRIQWRVWLIVVGIVAAAGVVVIFFRPPGGAVAQLLIRGAVFVLVFAALAMIFRPLESDDVRAFSSVPPLVRRVLSRIARPGEAL